VVSDNGLRICPQIALIWSEKRLTTFCVIQAKFSQTFEGRINSVSITISISNSNCKTGLLTIN